MRHSPDRYTKVDKRIVNVTPLWPDANSPIYSSGCTHANLLWTDDHEADELSRMSGSGPLAHDIVFRDSVSLYW